MIGNGVGDGGALLLVERVVAAHDALQLREFANHVADEVGLAENAGALGVLRVRTNDWCEVLREMPDALYAVVLAAELFVESDLLQLRHPSLERDLAILIEEELRIRQPRGDDALIALGYRGPAVLGLEIGNQHEAVGEVIALRHREALLMRLHGGGEHFRRHAQEVLVEASHERHRPFGEPRVLGQQSSVLDEPEAMLACARACRVQDRGGAHVAVENDEGFFEFCLVVGEVLHGEVLRRHEAMAARDLAAFDAVDVERHDLAVKQAEDGMERTHPAEFARAPAHGLRPRKGAHDLRHDLGDDIGRVAPRLFDQRDIEIALLVLADLRLVQRA